MKTMPNSTVVYPAAFLLWIATLGAAVAEGRIVHDRARKSITMADGSGGLMLRLNYDGRCMLDRVVVRGADVVRSNTGVYSAIRIGGAEYSTRSAIPSPKVDVSGDTVTASGIRFGGSGVDPKTAHQDFNHRRLIFRTERKSRRLDLGLQVIF